MNRTIKTIAASSLLLLATGCAVPQGAGSLQGSAANAITGVADRMSGRNSGASDAGANAAHNMRGVQGMMNGGSAGLAGTAYGAAGAGVLGVADQGLRSALTAMQGDAEVGYEDVANMQQNIEQSEPYVNAEGNTCIDYHVSISGGPEDAANSVTACQNERGEWEQM
jgi:hypothetical protein